MNTVTKVNGQDSPTQLEVVQQKLQREFDNHALAQVRHLALIGRLMHLHSSTIKSDQEAVDRLTNATAQALVNMTQEQDDQRPEFATRFALNSLYVIPVPDFVLAWCEAFQGDESRRSRAVECALSLSRCKLLGESEKKWAADCANALRLQK
jgi:hypothetical protein